MGISMFKRSDLFPSKKISKFLKKLMWPFWGGVFEISIDKSAAYN